MMEHAKEPWRLVGHGEVVAGDNNTVAVILEDAKAAANASRIVACVNACAGLTTEYLETVGLPEFVGKTLCADLAQQEIDRVTTQRDQLLAALEGLIDLYENPASFSGKTGEQRMLMLENQAAKSHAAIHQARQAIAAVKGA